MSLWKARNKNGKIQWIKDLITENQGEKAYISWSFWEKDYMGIFL